MAARDTGILDSDLAEIEARGVEALPKLGRFREPIERFLDRVNRISWMGRVGQSEAWDDQVERVWTLEEAGHLHDDYMEMSMIVSDSLERIARHVDRSHIVQAADALCIARLELYPPTTTYDSNPIAMEIYSTCWGALREIVVEDIVNVGFHREAIEWYERGHWLCAIRHDGRRVVY